MIRVFCDSCNLRGVENDLTARQDYVRVPFLDQRARVLDLCKENGCYDAYLEFERRYKERVREHASEFRKLAEEEIEKFWKEVTRGRAQENAKKARINATKAGREVGSV